MSESIDVIGLLFSQIIDRFVLRKKLNEKLKYNFGTIINNNGINLSEAIKSIASSDAKSNKKLMGIIEQYAGAINTGLYEERLYETFLHKMSAFDYLMPVEEAVKKHNGKIHEIIFADL